jgi:hypothetical protein
VTLFNRVKQVWVTNLQISNICGQTYDNAVVMKGEDKELQELIKTHQ